MRARKTTEETNVSELKFGLFVSFIEQQSSEETNQFVFFFYIQHLYQHANSCKITHLADKD
jgi:hypothetical protein